MTQHISDVKNEHHRTQVVVVFKLKLSEKGRNLYFNQIEGKHN